MNNHSYLEETKRVVAEAKSKLTLRDVWDLAPMSGHVAFPSSGTGVVKSPLREDKRPSFSIFDGGRAFDDKARAGLKGGVWEFVREACPNMESKDIARLLVDRAGLSWPVWHKDVAGSESDTDKAKRMSEERKARARAEQARRDQMERERRADRDGRGRKVVGPLAWPGCVADRWREGARWCDTHPDLLRALCKRRGWPVAWSDTIIAQDLLAFPIEPRFAADAAKPRRMVAFRVQAPNLLAGAVASGRAQLVDVGYHQKFYNVQEKTSGWRFIPSVPKKAAAACSDFELGMAAAAAERGVSAGQPMVTPLPFVAGCVDRPRLVIIMEGQWDAITMMGALGGLDMEFSSAACGVTFFGIRGVNGIQAFVDHWGAWMRAVKPLAWMLPDNDVAKTGSRWFPPARAVERKHGMVYFSERLARLGARRVVVTPLRGDAGGKDFNDYYRAASPDAAAMRRWMDELQLT